MRTRASSGQRTPPLPTKEFGAPPADSPALRRLISLGLGALALWGCWGLVPRPEPAKRLHIFDILKELPSPPPPAHVERALPVTVSRALPVLGATYPATLPDGQLVRATWKGTVALFSQLPSHPAPGDEFGVTEGQGLSWIWATPYGWSHPVWIDP